ncbi:MAG: MogA/MoaB family molybdenum cofactor biosynthesis protein [Chloroflexi bacterium]|nr:MogA/MoaB family molybdenum cofactor biosynthesis protein [Chloroflexota bacterium]
MIHVAILIVSDKSYQGSRGDQTGPALTKVLSPHASVSPVQIIPDEFEMIKAALIELSDRGEYDIIFTSGGTGLSPRDVTPEATLAVVERLAPGIPEAMRAASLEITPRAMLSRAISGVRGKTLIVNLPGSPKGALENLQIFLPTMLHAVETLRGDAHECAPLS